MNAPKTRLARAIGTAVSMGVAASIATPVVGYAQAASTSQSDKATTKTLQAVVVTGSRIQRVDLETSNPVVAVSAQQIQETGKQTIGAVLQDLPVITGGMMTPNVNIGGAGMGSGSTLVGLRGLGASRTLVLINGQRIVHKDLDAIPAAAVERIEVLTDGASAIYGSDAIGGVINIILKSRYNGAQVSLNYGISDHNDGERTGGSFVFGHTTSKGSILAGVSYNKQDSIVAAARKFSADALSILETANGGMRPTIGGSTYTDRDRINVPQNVASQFGCTSGNQLSLNA